MRRLALLLVLCRLCVEASAKEFRIAAGEGWIPFSLSRDVEAGSALDFSGIVPHDAPSGRNGFVRAVGGHFEFEGCPGVPQRFLGANLCLEANYPRTGEEADRLVVRLLRAGYNSIRLHHHDNALYRVSPEGRLELDPDRIARLDLFLAKAFDAGLYVTTDLYVSRKVTRAEIGEEQGDGTDPVAFKTLLFCHEGAMRDWQDAARLLFLHRNPHTGRTYAEEPGIACVCLVNENSIQQGIRGNAGNPFLKEAWRLWLLAQRADEPDSWPSLSPEEIPISGGGWSDAPILEGEAWDAVSRFSADLERRMFTQMRAFLRGELGVRIPLTDQNWGTQSGPMQEVRAELYDYADAHIYVNHPDFPETGWRLPSTLKNENILEQKGFGFEISWRRTFGQPFAVSEWNFCGPGRHRSMAGLYMGALAALQDWSALWRFSFAHWRNAYDSEPAPIGYFDIANDPSGLVSERLTAALFLRGDLAPLADAAATVLTEESVRPPNRDRAYNVLPTWWRRQLDFRVGTARPCHIPAGVVAVPMDAAAEDGAEPPIAGGGSPSVAHDPTRGTISIATQRTCALYASGEGVFCAGPLAVGNRGGAATVWATSLDGQPLEASGRMLFVRLGDIQGCGARYADETRTKLVDWGSAPCMEAGRCEVKLDVCADSQSSNWQVWALSTSGSRLAEIPCSFAGGALRFTADAARDPNEATFLYEVIRECAWKQ